MDQPKENGEKVDRKKSSVKINATKTQNGISEVHLESMTKHSQVLADLWNFQTRGTKSPSKESLEKERYDTEGVWRTFCEWMITFEKRLTDDIAQLKLLDLQSLIAKKDEIQVALSEAEHREKELESISKSFQRFAQLLSAGPERSEIKQQISHTRKRYQLLLALAVKTRETFRYIVPLLSEYTELGAEIKSWLDVTEVRSQLLVANYQDHKYLVDNHEEIENIFDELSKRKGTYERFINAGESILDLKDNDFEELRQDLTDVAARWDALCLNMEKFLHRLLLVKKMDDDSKRSESERIERQIRSAAQRCTCLKPFKIVKVGDGKYTFGDSKIVRLVRINGTSVVVRVGGGWDYLYEFLLKNDPCRASQVSSKSGTHPLSISDLDLTPNEKFSEFILTLGHPTQPWGPLREAARKHKQENLTQAQPQAKISLGSAASSECSDDADPASPTEATRAATPGRAAHKSNTPRSKATVGEAEDREASQQVRDGTASTQDVDKKPSDSTKDVRRLSLVERQAMYAEKRRSVVISEDLEIV